MGTVILLPFLFGYMFTRGLGIPMLYEMTGLVVYTASWFGVLAGMSVHDDIGRNLLIHLKLTRINRTICYFLSYIIGASLLSFATSLSVIAIFLPSYLVSISTIIIVSLLTVCVSFAISASLALQIKRTTAAYGTINALFVVLTYTGNTVIPFNNPILLINPLSYLVNFLR